MLLAIDTAGSGCSAAVARGGTVIAAERLALRHGHGEALFPLIERVMSAAGAAPMQLDIVAVAIGPGGFTGIRVGLAAAHGIALAARARLIGITSFAAVAAAISRAERDDCNALLVALDSRRDDVYVQVFPPAGMTPLAPPKAVLPERLAEYLASLIGGAPLLIAGDAAETAAAALEGHTGMTLAGASPPDALGVVAATLAQPASGVAIDAPRPLYLRPPDVTMPQARQTAAVPAS